MKYILATLGFSLAVVAFAPSQPSSCQTTPQIGVQDSRSVPFTDFDAQIEVESGEFEVRGTFSLGAPSNGIDLFKEDVAFAVGALTRTIPAGSFKEEKRGKIRFTETSKDTVLEVTIKIVGNNKFDLKIEGSGLKVPKTVRPDEVTLRIGDDEGRARARSK
jgi:hypothetical protein